MPRCYFLALSAGSSLYQQSNNVSLFQLVEQVNVAEGTALPVGRQLPIEIHAYFYVHPQEIGQTVEMRFSLVASTGLETFSETMSHRVATPRYRTRTMGLPYPATVGHYDLRVDFRVPSSGSVSSSWESGTLSAPDPAASSWVRDPLAWPITFLEQSRAPTVTH